MAMLNNHRADHLLHGWLSPRQAMSPSDQGAGHWEVGHPFFSKGKILGTRGKKHGKYEQFMGM